MSLCLCLPPPPLADGVAAFRAFLKTEFSEENLEFWLACEEFKKIRSTAKLATRAHRIFEEFVDVQAPREVRPGLTWHYWFPVPLPRERGGRIEAVQLGELLSVAMSPRVPGIGNCILGQRQLLSRLLQGCVK